MFGNLFGHLFGFIKEFFSKPEIWILLVVAIIGGALVTTPTQPFLASLSQFLRLTWWFLVFFPLFGLFEHAWLFWRQMIFIKNIQWSMMEIIVPRENEKTPKAMEQVFRALHSLRNSPSDVQEKYWDGEVPRWFSFEVVTIDGEIHLYIRFYTKSKNLVEAAFYSQYPDIELRDVSDYMENMPKSVASIETEGKDMWGVEMDLVREEIYPIVSYKTLMDDMEPERNVDPISTLLENISRAKPEEFIGLQILISPQDNKVWRSKWEDYLNEIKEKTVQRQVVPSEEEEQRPGTVARAPGEIELLRDLDNNLGKPAFETTIRILYIAPKEVYFDTFPRRGIVGALNQYASLGRNSFKMNPKTMTKTRIWYSPYLFPKLRAHFKKERLIFNYATREMPQTLRIGYLITSHRFNWNVHSKMFHMSVESLATLFHPPTSIVMTAPHIRRAESKRAGPSVGMSIFGEDENIEKFQ